MRDACRQLHKRCLACTEWLMQSLEKMDAIVSELTAMHVHVRKPELAIAVQNLDKNCPMSRTKMLKFRSNCNTFPQRKGVPH